MSGTTNNKNAGKPDEAKQKYPVIIRGTEDERRAWRAAAAGGKFNAWARDALNAAAGLFAQPSQDQARIIGVDMAKGKDRHVETLVRIKPAAAPANVQGTSLASVFAKLPSAPVRDLNDTTRTIPTADRDSDDWLEAKA